MPDLAERLREFVDMAQPTITRTEIDEALARHRKANVVSRMAHYRRPLAAGCLVAACIVALVAILLVTSAGPPLSTQSPFSARASASAVLAHAALAADAQQPLVPGPGEFLYVRLLDGEQEAQAFSANGSAAAPTNSASSALSRYYVDEVLEQWTSPSGPNHQTSTVVGQPEFITGTDRQLWEQAGSPPIESGYSGGGTPNYYDVADLPTDPSKMSAYFASQSDLVQEQTATGEPLNSLWDFATAATFLEHGASSLQRAALLRYMATIPGVKNAGSGTTLGTKRNATILAIPSTRPGYRFEVLIDQKTSEVLEVGLVVSDPSKLNAPTPAQIASGHAIAPLQTGQAEYYQDFLYDGIADSSGSLPYGAAPLPPTWPFGTAREPLAGSAY